MSKRAHFSRRVFLKQTTQAVSAAMVAPTLLPACARGANEKIRLGFIGLGWRFNLIMEFMPKDGFEITAFSDINDSRMEVAKSKYKKVAATYKDYRELLASGKVDAVVIASPDHWHALHTIDACKAGKDVYVEKPLSLTIAEGASMIKVARSTNRIVQVGIQQRSRAICMQGCQSVLDGMIGKVTEVHGYNYPSAWDCDITETQEVPRSLDWDTWIGQSQPHAYHYDIYKGSFQPGNYPDGRPKGWLSYTAWSGGAMTAWGAHGIDIIAWGLGNNRPGPIEVWPEPWDENAPIMFGDLELKDPVWKEGHALTCPLHYKYADGTVIHLDNKAPGFGGLFAGSDGAIMVDRDNLQIKRSGEKMTIIAGPPNDDGSTTEHLADWLACIKSRKLSRGDVEIAHGSTTMCHLGNIARRLGRKIIWDPKTETFGDDKEANSHIRREARKPWVVA